MTLSLILASCRLENFTACRLKWLIRGCQQQHFGIVQKYYGIFKVTAKREEREGLRWPEEKRVRDREDERKRLLVGALVWPCALHDNHSLLFS